VVPLRLRFVAVVAIILVMTSTPALNCMSNLYKMNQEEMVCFTKTGKCSAVTD
jgi:hypothetical protein